MRSWSDAITESFPPPHKREPRNLRADIFDELADHLECALRREQIRTTDDKAAEKAVLERFGDPKAIARRLWWDAMKGRIMKDRLFLVVFSVALLAIVAGFVLPWAARQQHVNEMILKRLDQFDAKLSDAGRGHQWSSVKIRVVQENAGQSPIPGIKLQLQESHYAGSLMEEPLERTTDADGLADFGPVNSGHYQLRVFAGSIETWKKFHVSPGQAYESTITVPLYEPMRTTVQFRIKNATSKMLFACRFVPPSLLPPASDGSSWRVGWGPFSVLLRPDGTIVKGFKPNPGSGGDSDEALTAAATTSQPTEQTVSWPVGTYTLNSMTVYRIAAPVVGAPAPTQPHWETVGGSPGFIPEMSHAFQAKPSQTNLWELSVPMRTTEGR